MPGPDATPFARVEVLDEVDSTNTEAQRRGIKGERGPLWIRAQRQVSGKGRMGRTWATPRGNFAATLLFAPRCPPAALPQLSLLAGIAACDGITALAGSSPVDGLRLKWPNDLLVGTAKLGGILVECANVAGETIAMIGIGINMAFAPPADGRLVAALADHGIAAGPDVLLARIDEAVAHWLSVWEGGVGFARIREAWMARAGPIGEPIAVNAGGGRSEGAYAGLDEDGALLMRGSDSQLQRITFGDVALGTAPQEGSAHGGK